jgi:sugar/nucleoside kinase (ribokinase family)
MSLDVYLHGMTVLSTIHRISGSLEVDGYGEIAETHVCPGGEAMNAAMLLSGLGISTALGGPHWGTESREVLGRYARRYGIDVTGIRLDDGYPGVRDLVLVDDRHRTVLGWFGRYFSAPDHRWGEPDESAIARARAVAVDPFFGATSELAARMAAAAGKPCVTIDCPYDGPLHATAAGTVVAREWRSRHYPGVPDGELLARYASHGSGLTIFTSGKDEIRFGRRGEPGETFAPFRVEVKSTLGAGDTFRAGVVYGVLRGFPDREIVRFASGLAALVCTRLPIADNIPSLAEVEEFLRAAATPRAG